MAAGCLAAGVFFSQCAPDTPPSAAPKVKHGAFVEFVRYKNKGLLSQYSDLTVQYHEGEPVTVFFRNGGAYRFTGKAKVTAAEGCQFEVPAETGTGTYYFGCESSDIYDHEPPESEDRPINR